MGYRADGMTLFFFFFLELIRNEVVILVDNEIGNHDYLFVTQVFFIPMKVVNINESDTNLADFD